MYRRDYNIVGFNTQAMRKNSITNVLMRALQYRVKSRTSHCSSLWESVAECTTISPQFKLVTPFIDCEKQYKGITFYSVVAVV